MSRRPIVKAVQCPTCGTWVEDAPLCSWCTVDLRTGSWQHADMPVALRELRHHWSPLEFGPTRWDVMLPSDAESVEERRARNREWQRASRARRRQEAAA